MSNVSGASSRGDQVGSSPKGSPGGQEEVKRLVGQLTDLPPSFPPSPSPSPSPSSVKSARATPVQGSDEKLVKKKSNNEKKTRFKLNS